MAGKGRLKGQVRWLFHCTGCGAKWMLKHTLDNEEALAGVLNEPTNHCDECNTPIEGELVEIITG